jgi:alanine-alpha-ketoisovalerate/valine-pyruvate aminotransferase
LPYVFTEFGALMAANVLNSSQAVKMSLYVIRAFVKSRDELAANSAIVKRLAQIALPQIAKSLNRPVAKCFSFLWKNQ